jgi:hypothetical protein
MFVKVELMHVVGADDADPADGMDADLKTKRSAELRSDEEIVTVRFPVAPLVSHDVHAAPMDALSKFVVT